MGNLYIYIAIRLKMKRGRNIMNSKRILSLVLAMVLAVSLCLPVTTAYAIEPEDDDL